MAQQKWRPCSFEAWGVLFLSDSTASLDYSWHMWLITRSDFILSIFLTHMLSLFSLAATMHCSEELKYAFIFKFGPCDKAKPVTHLPSPPNNRQAWMSPRAQSVDSIYYPLCENTDVFPATSIDAHINFLCCPLSLLSDSFIKPSVCLVNICCAFLLFCFYFKSKIRHLQTNPNCYDSCVQKNHVKLRVV